MEGEVHVLSEVIGKVAFHLRGSRYQKFKSRFVYQKKRFDMPYTLFYTDTC